jgi:hypothetical protein
MTFERPSHTSSSPKVGRMHLAEALSYRVLADEVRRAA